MKIVKNLSNNQMGMSLVAVLASITLGLGGITYLIKDALPRLQNEKKKIDAQLAYRMFISSTNDYLVHGLRERWCINYENGVSDLLLSNYCSSKASMEDIVTYPGNLERVLWGPETIGNKLTTAPAVESANKILALNFLRHQDNKTSKLLNYDQVAPANGTLNFRVTEKILRDMNDSHPLFIMSQKIMECVNHIDIEIFQVKDFSNLPSGDEKKVGIRIKADIKTSRLSCLAVRRAESVSYYTFYPRRLHTMSLVKYGDLDGNYFNEFHGPVYVAGNFILPNKDAPKDSTTVFYNSLTLGIFNGGKRLNTLIPGRVLQENKKPFSFAERGHPYLSKQDNYQGFRGFLGGLKLDSSEDKGFYNLFDHSSKTAADLAQLEACIEDNQSQLKKSKNANSKLLYKTNSKDPESIKLMLSFDQKNRFDLADSRPRVLSNTEHDRSSRSYFNISTENTEASKALGQINFYIEDRESFSRQAKENYTASIGDNSSVLLNVDFEKFELTAKDLEDYTKNFNEINRSNYNNLIASSVLRNTQTYRSYDHAAKALIFKCDRKVIEDCRILGYQVPPCGITPPPRGGDTGGGNTSGRGGGPGRGDTGREFNAPEEEEEEEEVEDDDRGSIGQCGAGEYSNELRSFNIAKDNLLSKINELKDYQDKKNTFLEIKVNQVAPFKGQTVLNQRNLDMKFSPGWQEYFKLIYGSLNTFEITFTPYHNGVSDALKLKLTLMSNQNGNNPRIIRARNFYSTEVQDLKSNWSNTYNNDNAPTPDPIIELNCPQGMNMADWDLDMSASTNFAWNYANTPAGAFVDTNDHQQADPIIFHPGNPPLEGHAYSTTKSVVSECIIPSDRTHVYGFYVCEKLTVRDRTAPLYMIGTFIVRDLVLPRGMTSPIHWYSVWDTKATDLIMTDLNGSKSNCKSVKDLTSKTWKDVVTHSRIAATVDSCGPLDLVSNGPNNFSWTTVDPDVGIAQNGDTMTSQKVNRIQKWVIREESRSDLIR